MDEDNEYGMYENDLLEWGDREAWEDARADFGDMSECTLEPAPGYENDDYHLFYGEG